MRWLHLLFLRVLSIRVAEEDCTPPAVKALLRNESTLDLEQLLWKKQVFSFLRLGDFEVSCLAAAKNTNLDGISVQEKAWQCDRFAEKLAALGHRVDDSRMHVLLATYMFCNYPFMASQFEDFLAKHPMHFRGFLSSIFYVDLALKSKMPLERPSPASWPQTFPGLRGRTVVVCGPPALKNLTKSLNIAAFLDASRAIDHVDGLVKAMRLESARRPKENVIFLISGSIGGKLALLLAYDALGAKDTLIDMGASLDGLAGLESRDFNRRQHKCTESPQFMLPGLCTCDSYGRVCRPS